MEQSWQEARKRCLEDKTVRKVGVVLFSVLTILLGGLTALNYRWNESWRLFWYDFKSGFSSTGYLYVICMAAVLVFALTAGALLWLMSAENKTNSFRRKLERAVIIVGAVILIPCAVINYGNIRKAVVKCEWEPERTIGHSFGAIEGNTYTCSKEAFDYNYSLGRRTFEVDMLLTTDNQIVLKHDWDSPVQEGISEENPPTGEQFLAAKLDGKYTPMSYEMLCRLMVEYPDIWIVTDTKYTEPEEIRAQFSVLIEDAKAYGCPEILDRLIVQVYSEQMHQIVSSMYDFKSYIFTMYKLFHGEDKEGSLQSACRYCVNNGIEIVTIDYTKYNDAMKRITERYGRTVYLHTLDDADLAAKFLSEGVYGIYTNSILEKDLWKEDEDR